MTDSWIVSPPLRAMPNKLFGSGIQMTLAASNINATLQTATDKLPKLKVFKGE